MRGAECNSYSRQWSNVVSFIELTRVDMQRECRLRISCNVAATVFCVVVFVMHTVPVLYLLCINWPSFNLRPIFPFIHIEWNRGTLRTHRTHSHRALQWLFSVSILFYFCSFGLLFAQRRICLSDSANILITGSHYTELTAYKLKLTQFQAFLGQRHRGHSTKKRKFYDFRELLGWIDEQR